MMALQCYIAKSADKKSALSSDIGATANFSRYKIGERPWTRAEQRLEQLRTIKNTQRERAMLREKLPMHATC